VVDLEALASQQEIEGLAREAHAMAGYQHPHVLPLHCAFVHLQQLWLVMPYMEVRRAAGRWPAASAYARLLRTTLWLCSTGCACMQPGP
jgi:hypothetical protein